jgi:hypothetical protein
MPELVDQLKQFFDETQGDRTDAAHLIARKKLSFDPSRLTDDDWNTLYEYYAMQHGDYGKRVSTFENFKAGLIANLAEVMRLSDHYKK